MSCRKEERLYTYYQLRVGGILSVRSRHKNPPTPRAPDLLMFRFIITLPLLGLVHDG
jgi:hypothetical protein